MVTDVWAGPEAATDFTWGRLRTQGISMVKLSHRLHRWVTDVWTDPEAATDVHRFYTGRPLIGDICGKKIHLINVMRKIKNPPPCFHLQRVLLLIEKTRAPLLLSLKRVLFSDVQREKLFSFVEQCKGVQQRN
jgi:hypothetical protein